MSLEFILNVKAKKLRWVGDEKLPKKDKDEYFGHESFFYPFQDNREDMVRIASELLQKSGINNNNYLNEITAKDLLKK